MRPKKMNGFILAFSLFTVANAQTIFPGLVGKTLLDSLANAYKVTKVQSYNTARDLLYGKILLESGDSLACVYTRYKIKLNTASPRSDAYDQGINAEHTWPQSLGASGNAKSDMHHIFPTREDANSARGSKPFGESPDQSTTTWFWKDKKSSLIPTTHIDEYSEDNPSLFEPREDHKGNVARAMFYFFTMYRNQSDSNFFNTQKEILLTWHRIDTADTHEVSITQQIAAVQGNPNPFVLDSSLVMRAYFPGQIQSLKLIHSPNTSNLLSVWPNPANPGVHLAFPGISHGRESLQIFSLGGMLVRTFQLEEKSSSSVYWDGFLENGRQAESGVYLARIQRSGAVLTRKFVILR